MKCAHFTCHACIEPPGRTAYVVELEQEVERCHESLREAGRQVAAAYAERDELRAEVERLRGLLRESCDLTDEALGCAPDYFKVKWGLPGAAARIRREGGLTEVERLKRGKL